MTLETLSEAQARYYADLNRQRGNKGLLLELLLDGEWHANRDCASVGGLSFNDTLFCLRKEGWVIESRHVRGGTWEFRLTGKTEPDDSHRPLTRPQRLVARTYEKAIEEKLGAATLETVRGELPPWMRSV